MIQTPIRDYNGVRFNISEGASILSELNARTESDQEGYNSIDELATKIKNLPSGDTNGGETVVNTSGSVSAQPTPTTFLRFDNQVSPVVLSGLAGEEDGKEIVVWNQTLQALDLLHDSPAAIAEQRLTNLGSQDLLLPIDAKATYRYSLSLLRWEMIAIEGAGYQPTLLGGDTRAMTVDPNGIVEGEEIMELKAWDVVSTSDKSKADLNLEYPNAKQGFVVLCPNNDIEYELYDEINKDWISRVTTKVV